MAEFNNGSGEIKSTKMLAALAEIIEITESEEEIQNVPTERLTQFSMSRNGSSGTVNVSGTLQITESVSGEGLLAVPTDYLSNRSFDSGTGGDLSATTIPGALYQMLRKVRNHPDGANFVTTFSRSSTDILSYQVVFPVTFSIDSTTGKTVQTVTEALT